MYPGGGGGGYGYPPQNSGAYPQQATGIGFDHLSGGGPAAPAGGGYGYPPAQSPYLGTAGGYAGSGPQAYPNSGAAPYPGGGGAAASPYPPAGGGAPYPGAQNTAPSFAGAAYAATAAANFYPSPGPSYPQQGGYSPQQPPQPPQPSYPSQPSHPAYGQQQPPAPYGTPPTQAPSFAGAAYATSAALNFQHAGGYPQQQQQSQQPYSYPSNQTASYHSSGAALVPPTKQLDQMHLGGSTAAPKRPPPPSSSPTPQAPIPQEPPTQGTIKEAHGFDAQRDAEILRKAMKGMGTDESAITSVLGSRSNHQRQKIKLQFATMYGKDLIKELKSELSGNYETVVLELLMAPAEYDAYHCRNAVSGLGTDESCLIEILCSRSNAEIRALCESYKKLYKSDLEKDIKSDTSGHFERLLISLVQGGRPENVPLDHQKATQDAQALYQAGEAKWGTDESRFNVILASRSIPQLRLTFNEYEKVSKKKNLEKAISSEMSGDLKEGMLSVVKCARNKPSYFAERLYKSMKGLGTDDKTLIRIMVSRCEVDMVQIKQEFQRAYGKTLDSFIKDDCSGDYKKLLMQLCIGN